MTPHPDSNANEIIRSFLDHPLDRTRFGAFFELIYRDTLGTLTYLKRKGYRFPDPTGSAPNRLNDLAIDILGAFLAGSTVGQPYPIVLDYFRRAHEQTRSAEQKSDLHPLLLGLLRGFIRQELSRLLKQDDPQIDNLKRRFKDLLNATEFATISFDGSSSELVFLSQHRAALRPDRPLIPYGELELIARETFAESHTRADWCRAIFDRINAATDFQNLVRKHELLRAVIIVNMEFLEIDAWQPSGLPRPRQALLRKIADQALDETLAWTKESIIAEFLAKKRISSEEADLLYLAAEKYLTDYAFDGQTDAVPAYYREVMPEAYHARYLKDYKYVFETIVSKSVENFVERLKNDSTVAGFGRYRENGGG
jgi:hypothetical protein